MGKKTIDDRVKSIRQVVPMIYAYTTPEIARHDGWTKIGYTEQTVGKRVGQQTHTADIEYHEEWKGNATFDDGTGDFFKDSDFHNYLIKKKGIERKPGTEWFHISGEDSHDAFIEFRTNRGLLSATNTAVSYVLRAEQEKAIEQTTDYNLLHESGEFLWNAKPRFGKTLSAYDFCKRNDVQNVLIVTNRPAIANSWYEDYVKFLGMESGYLFVSHVDALMNKKYVMTREEYAQYILDKTHAANRCIEFVSLQDLKGAIKFGGDYDKLNEVADILWDVLIIDEAHEGVDTYKTDVAFDHIKRNFTLHLSGTPFKALANDKFRYDAIYNWTYADEQKAKHSWADPEKPNPYANLPQLNLFTYQMSEIIADQIDKGIEINGETEEYAFDLNDFFGTENGRFIHNDSVDKFLNALTTREKYPFSTDVLRNELKHTLWLLNRVDSAKALMRKLQKHPIFKDYYLILAAGDGKIDDDDENQKSFDKVKDAIAKYDKTITLSVGQLTTGITIPEWTAVLMLSNVKSPSLYMQAAFRSQNPCLFHDKDGSYYRKENSYVFDFDPARTLIIFEEFANDLSADTSSGRGDSDTRKQHVRELLNFFPVIGEDEDGSMIELDAEKVLSIPRKIRSKEVVRRGFMSDFLFQNISNVFHAPQAVMDIIKNLTPEKAPTSDINVTPGTAEDLNLNDDGNVEIPAVQVIGTANEMFGPKIYDAVADKMDDVIKEASASQTEDEDAVVLENMKKAFVEQAVKPILNTAQADYANDLRPAEKNRLERKLTSDCDREMNKRFGDYQIQKRTLEKEHADAVAACETNEEAQKADMEYESKKKQAVENLKKDLSNSVDTLVHSAGEDVVRAVETNKKEQTKRTIEDGIKDHLRGFSRTIPSFLMAYGDEKTTLATFDTIIPDSVFLEVTSISLENFRFLRDGGDYKDDETGETRHFDGHLFDPVVFDDSIKEFIRLRTDLSDYFDEEKKEDIFNYIPPQKTNQIFTPKWVVEKMADMLEEQNPGCFDDPAATFSDLYMKSGLYITEIVKRLYRSEKMKELFPDNAERIRHILGKQVFGAAPTEIIYRIAMQYILGFDPNLPSDIKTNFVCKDTAALAKDGKLAEFVQTTFGDKLQ